MTEQVRGFHLQAILLVALRDLENGLHMRRLPKSPGETAYAFPTDPHPHLAFAVGATFIENAKHNGFGLPDEVCDKMAFVITDLLRRDFSLRLDVEFEPTQLEALAGLPAEKRSQLANLLACGMRVHAARAVNANEEAAKYEQTRSLVFPQPPPV